MKMSFFLLLLFLIIRWLSDELSLTVSTLRDDGDVWRTSWMKVRHIRRV